MKKALLAGIFLLGAAGFVGAQSTGICGVVDQAAILERLEQNKRALRENPSLRNDQVLYVPLQFHIVTLDDGTGGVSEEKILEQLCRLNEDYEPIGMQFYLKDDFNYIAYKRLYEDPGHTFANNKMLSNKVNNAMNIFIVDQIGSITLGTTLGYYTPQNDWIVVVRSRVNGNNQTLSHEIGHFFSLAHPFYGWEGCPYDQSEHGNPLNITHIPCSGDLIELVDQSNCEITADRICDTPPDYNFGLTDPEDNCSLDYEVRDLNGDLIDVMENNYMSYFFNCGEYVFTQTQKELMRADFQSSGRNYIRGSYVPDTTELTGDSPEIIHPVYNATTEFYNDVWLDWTDVPGVKNYLVKVTTGFFTQISNYYQVKNASELVLTHLPPGENNVTVIIWPYNEGNSCNSFPSQTHKFKTSSIPVGVTDLEIDSQIKWYPSPVPAGLGSVTLWSAGKLGSSTMELIDASGRTVFSSGLEIISGTNRISLPSGVVQPGAYVIRLNNGDKSYSKKMLFTE
jgi:hypothetical protein